jgi:hypothetical protein
MIQLDFFLATAMAAGLYRGAAEKLLLALEWEGHEFTHATSLWAGVA